jgi:hypothetical protein
MLCRYYKNKSENCFGGMMKFIWFVIIQMLVVISLFSIDVSGNQSGFWSPSDNPINVVGNVTVPVSDSLIILPGTIINFTGNFSITVQGYIVAEGTETDSIFFSSSTNWEEIRLENNQQPSRFVFCVISNGTTLINSINSPVSVRNSRLYNAETGVNIFGVGYNEPANVIIENTLISHCDKSGIFIVENSNAVVDSCDISYCALNNQPHGAIQVSNQSTDGECNPTISNCYIHHNVWQGITAFDITGNMNIFLNCSDNLIERNLTGIYLLYATGKFDGNTIRNNYVSGNTNSGAGVMIAGSNSQGIIPVFTNNVVTGNFVGFYITQEGMVNLGCLDNYCDDDDGGNHIFANIDESGTNYSVYNASSYDCYAQNNIWDSTDYNEIDQTIIDQNDNENYGLVTYDPIYQETHNETNDMIATEDIKIFPNPFMIRKAKTNQIKVSLNNKIYCDDIGIFNLKGQLVAKKVLKSVTNNITFSAEKINNSGIYFIKISGQKEIIKKFIVLSK